MSNLAQKIHLTEETHSIDPAEPEIRVSGFWEYLANAVYPCLVRFLTGMLIVALCLWILAGVIYLIAGLPEILSADWAGMAEHVIIKALIMLALLEVIRTLQAYLKLGRVRVTFILDTALVVLIGELMGLWFKEYSPAKVMLGVVVIAILVGLRIVTAKYSLEPHGL
jgi:uncharacterized membrane protein (DUF373 family)